MNFCTLAPAVVGAAGKIITGIRKIEDAQALKAELEGLKKNAKELKKNYDKLKLSMQKKKDELEAWRDILDPLQEVDERVDDAQSTATHTRNLLIELADNSSERNKTNNRGKTRVRNLLAQCREFITEAKTVATDLPNAEEVKKHLDLLERNLKQLAGTIGIFSWDILLENAAPGAETGNVTFGDLQSSVGALQGLAKNAYRPDLSKFNG